MSNQPDLKLLYTDPITGTEYYQIPGFDDYGISKNGEVFDTTRGQALVPFLSLGYVRVRIRKSKSVHPTRYFTYKYMTAGIHRLLALTFLPPPSDPKQNQINHKDGNRCNNSLDNLEWCTQLENNMHALKNNLRSDNKHIEVKNLKTNEILHFYSLGECGDYFKVDKTNIHWWLNKRKNLYPFQKYYIIRYADQDWPDVGDIETFLNKPYRYDHFHNGVICIHDVIHDKVVFTNRRLVASNYLDINEGTLYKYMDTDKLFNNQYRIRHLVDTDKDKFIQEYIQRGHNEEDIIYLYQNLRNTIKNRCIGCKLIDHKYNTISIHSSMTEAYQTISKILKDTDKIHISYQVVKQHFLYHKSLSHRFEIQRLPKC
jgi:hypothetical protein